MKQFQSSTLLKIIHLLLKTVPKAITGTMLRQQSIPLFYIIWILRQNKLAALRFHVSSDHITHNTITAYAFLKTLINHHIKTKYHFFKSISDFSDGSPAEHRNYTNLLMHKKDFRMNAEWHFFAKQMLKLVSAIFYQIFYFNQMIAPQKLWKMFFISSKKLFSLLRSSNFCISIFSPYQPLLRRLIQDKS